MEIDITTLPPSTRERLENHARATEKRARCAEFAQLARTDANAAGSVLLAASEYEHLDMLRELEGDDVPDFVRASSARVRDRVLEIHPNPRWLRVQLVADEDVPRWTKIRHADYVDNDDATYHRERLVTGYFMHTSARDLSPAEVRRLRDAGAGHLVVPPKIEAMGYADGKPTVEPCTYKGLVIDGVETWRSEVLAAVREVDAEFAEAIASGKVVCTELPLADCRARMGA